MSLRARLIVAFVLLSVVPLSAVTLYSYSTSVHAFQGAVQREASQSAADIGRRMAMVTDDVGHRVDRLFEATNGREPMPMNDPQAVRDRIAPMLGDAAALVDKVEFEPEADALPTPATPSPPAAPEAPSAPGAPAAPVAPAAPRPPQAMVVDIPAFLAQTQKQIEAAGAFENDAKARKEFEKAMEKSMAMKETSLKAAAAAMAHLPESIQIRSADPSSPPVVIRLQGHDLNVPVRRNGKMVGHASARLNMNRTLGAILSLAQSDQGEVAFAIDQRGQLYTPDDSKRGLLDSLDVKTVAARDKPQRVGDWLVVTRKEPSGLTFGIARPLGESLREIRRASVRNLSLGLLVVALAIVGIVPISHRMTERLRALTGGVRQLAAGDFGTRVTVKSRDEFGQLADAFNHMAADLERHQASAVEQERLRRELELSRQIQEEMLPRAPLQFGAAEIKGISIPAREVGGDFFNYFELPGHRLGLLVGDVSGKGVSAALLMAKVQATLRARMPLQLDLAALADLLDRELDDSTPGGVFVTAFIAVLEDGGRTMRYVNAGHHPQYVLRTDGSVERLSSTGLPLGLFAAHGFSEGSVALSAGDALFFYTDGLVETQNEAGDMFDHARLETILLASSANDVDAVLQRVEEAVAAFRGQAEPFDDATMMALRV